MKRSKAYRKADELVDAATVYAPAQAIDLARKTSTTKFDSTVEVAIRLGVDPRKADQMVRGTVNLPHGTGKTARVLVFAAGGRAEEARADRKSTRLNSSHVKTSYAVFCLNKKKKSNAHINYNHTTLLLTVTTL